MLVGLLSSGVATALELTSLLSAEHARDRAGAQKQSVALESELSVSLENAGSLTAIVDIDVLGPDLLEPRRTDAPFVSQASRRWYPNEHVVVELREFYLDRDLHLAGIDGQVRLGKQQVVWGQADGLRLLDVVNPMDFREFILADFNDSRIPTWMANVELFLPFGDLQVLLIPDTTVNHLPPPGALYELTAPFANLPDGVPVVHQAFDTPGGIADGDAGMRLSLFRGGWDVTVNYMYRHDDLPVIYSRVENGTIVLAPGYERTHTVGGSFSNAFGDIVFRSEVVVNSDRYFAAPATVPGGVSRRSEVAYVVGFDWSGLSDTLISVQVFQSALTGSAPVSRDSVDTNVTLLVRHALLNESVQLEALWIHHVNDSDNLVRFSAAWEVATNWELSFYADVFTGEPAELFGQFDDRDRLGMKLTFGF